MRGRRNDGDFHDYLAFWTGTRLGRGTGFSALFMFSCFETARHTAEFGPPRLERMGRAV